VVCRSLAVCLLLLGCATAPPPAPGKGASGAPFQSFFGADAAGSGGCPGAEADAGDVAAPDDSDALCATPAPSVSFSREVSRLVGCTGEICHSAWTYDSLVSKKSEACCDHRPLVDPGHPSNSQLVQALLGISPCTERMPLGGQMSDTDVATVIDWVCQGALRD
jgi:hypothetical protein